MPSLAVGRDDAERRAELASSTWFWCEWFIAPGWNAVIWLSSRSVVMKACAVNWPAIAANVPRADAEALEALRVGLR